MSQKCSIFNELMDFFSAKFFSIGKVIIRIVELDVVTFQLSNVIFTWSINHVLFRLFFADKAHESLTFNIPDHSFVAGGFKLSSSTNNDDVFSCHAVVCHFHFAILHRTIFALSWYHSSHKYRIRAKISISIKHSTHSS